MFLCTPFENHCLVYRRLGFLKLAPCIAHQPDQTKLDEIHLITVVSVIKRLSLYEFTLWGRDLLYCPLSVLQRVFFEKIGKFCRDIGNSVRNTGNREVSVPRGLTVQLIETYQCAIFLNALYIKPNRRKMNKMYKQRKRPNDNRCNNNNNNLIIISNGNRTEWSPIRSVIIRVINKIGLPLRGRPICLITSMITDRIGRHEVLLPINHNFNKICDIQGSF